MVRQHADDQNQEVEEVTRIYIRHVRAAKICMSGARDWFKARGWSWSEFLANGWDLDEFEAVGCPIAARAAKIARSEVAGG